MENNKIKNQSGNNASANNSNSSATGIYNGSTVSAVPNFKFNFPFKKHERAKIDYTKKDTVFAFILLAFSILAIDLILFGMFRIGFTISYFLYIALMSVYILSKNIKLKPYPVFCEILALAISVTFSVYSDPRLKFVLVLAIIFLTAVFFSSLYEIKYPQGSYKSFYDILSLLLLATTVNMQAAMRSFLGNNEEKSKKARNIIIGICIAVPFVSIVLALLISADIAFENMMSKIADAIGESIIKIILGCFLSVFAITLAVTLNKKLKIRTETNISKKRSYKIDSTIINTFLIALSVVYLAFLFSQLAYFFTAFKGVLPDGFEFTYAEYARRGFFQMCAIAAINLVLLFISKVFYEIKKGFSNTFNKILSVFICLFTMLIIATAISKMFLYIKSFGLTSSRILASAFMVILCVVFIAVIIRLFAPNFPYLKVSVIAAAVVLLTLGTADIDKTVCRYNIWAYDTGKLKTIDVQSLSHLSESSIPYLYTLTQYDDNEISDAAYNGLYLWMTRLYDVEVGTGKVLGESEFSGYKSYTYSTGKAREIIYSNRKEIYEKGFIFDYEQPEIVTEVID